MQKQYENQKDIAAAQNDMMEKVPLLVQKAYFVTCVFVPMAFVLTLGSIYALMHALAVVFVGKGQSQREGACARASAEGP